MGGTSGLSRLQEEHWLRAYRIEARHEQDGRCYYCRSRLTWKDTTADHVVPRSKGGQTRRDNIRAACRACNKEKGDKTEGQFLALLKRPPERGAPVWRWLAWSRRRIGVASERACRHIAQSVGLAP